MHTYSEGNAVGFCISHRLWRNYGDRRCFNRAKVQIGDTVVVIGAGGVGLNVIQAADLVGASQIIAIDRVPVK